MKTFIYSITKQLPSVSKNRLYTILVNILFSIIIMVVSFSQAFQKKMIFYEFTGAYYHSKNAGITLIVGGVMLFLTNIILLFFERSKNHSFKEKMAYSGIWTFAVLSCIIIIGIVGLQIFSAFFN